MAKIEIKHVPDTQLEAGDIILLVDERAFWVMENKGEYMLVDAEDMEVVADELNHPIHVINHVKKHYAMSFRIVKNSQIKLVLGTVSE